MIPAAEPPCPEALAGAHVRHGKLCALVQPVRTALEPVEQNDRTFQLIEIRVRFFDLIIVVVNGVERFRTRNAIRRKAAGLLELENGLARLRGKDARDVGLAQKAAVIQGFLQSLHLFPFHALLQHADGRGA